MKGIGTLVFFCSLAVLTVCRRKVLMEVHDPATSKYTVHQDWFSNFIDHLDHSNHQTFQQRYWYSYDLWDKKTGPIIFYICAEGPGHFPGDSSFLMALAKEMNAAVVALEHRYYGASVPFPDLRLDYMRYLSHDQALADTAYFIKFFKHKLEDLAESPLKLFTIGGSYAGALSAWMRYKYPYLVDGALSSSGVVNAILDFSDFDDQVKRSVLKSGPKCEEIIQGFLKEVKEAWDKNSWNVKKMYRAPFMEWDDFMFYFADIFVEAVQYGSRTQLCAFLETIENDPKKHEKLAQFGEEHGVTANVYSFEYIRTLQTDPYNNYRQWTYQYCSSLGYLNTPGSGDRPLRFKEMNIEYWKRYCAKSFDAPVFPDTFHTNSLYGDLRIVNYTSNIIFTNGGEDPWQWAGVRSVQNNTKNIEAILIDCKNCGHCVELRGERPEDAPELKAARQKIRAAFRKWMNSK